MPEIALNTLSSMTGLKAPLGALAHILFGRSALTHLALPATNITPTSHHVAQRRGNIVRLCCERQSLDPMPYLNRIAATVATGHRDLF